MIPVSRLPEVLSFGNADELKDLTAEWLALAQGLPGSSYFQSPDWVLSWWETVAGRPPTEIAIWRDSSGALEALVAVSQVALRFVERLPLVIGVWANAGFGTGADHCGWPVLPQRVEDVRRWLVQRTAGTPLVLFGMDPETGVPLVPRAAHRITRYTCPRIELLTTGSPSDSPVRPHRRLAKRRRRLLREGIHFHWIPPDRMDDQILRSLFSLHEERFRMKGVPTFLTPNRMQLHQRLITRSAPGRGPCAMIAESEGRPIAIEYGFWWRDVFSSYQSGWDPAWAKTNVGKIVLDELIRFVPSEGARVFDFLHGTEELKYYFGAHDRWDETWILPEGIMGRVLLLKLLSEVRLHLPWSRPVARPGSRPGDHQSGSRTHPRSGELAPENRSKVAEA